MRNILPPNGPLIFVISRNVLSTASNIYLCAIAASSQIINLQFLIKFAKADWLLAFILHVEVSLISNGILNLECAVLPPSNNNAAIPDDATAKAISPSFLTLAKSVLKKKVLPVPP